MDCDPRVLIAICLDTHLEVDYWTAHLFDREGQIVATHYPAGCRHLPPIDALDEGLQWGADHLTMLYEGAFGHLTETRS